MRKIEQTSEKTGKSKTVKCQQCKMGFKPDGYYKSRSKRFALDGRLVWCNACIRTIFLEYAEVYNGDLPLALLGMCRLLDVPYIRDITEQLDLSDSAVIGKYLNRIGMNAKYNKYGFVDGDIITENQLRQNADDTALTEDAPCDFEITEEMRRLWKNPSYVSDDYLILWEHYTELQERHYDANDQQRGYFPVLADLFLKREKAGWREDGLDEYDKLSKLYNATYSAAGFTPKERAAVSSNNTTLSNIVQLAESESFIEPWLYRKSYPQRRDEVWRQELDNLNHINKNEGLPILKELPRYSVKVGTDDIYTKDEIEKAEQLPLDELEQDLHAEFEDNSIAGD